MKRIFLVFALIFVTSWATLITGANYLRTRDVALSGGIFGNTITSDLPLYFETPKKMYLISYHGICENNNSLVKIYDKTSNTFDILCLDNITTFPLTNYLNFSWSGEYHSEIPIFVFNQTGELPSEEPNSFPTLKTVNLDLSKNMSEVLTQQNRIIIPSEKITITLLEAKENEATITLTQNKKITNLNLSENQKINFSNYFLTAEKIEELNQEVLLRFKKDVPKKSIVRDLKNQMSKIPFINAQNTKASNLSLLLKLFFFTLI